MNLAPTELRQDMHSSREKERLPESPILRAPPHECGLKHVRTPNQFFNGIKLRNGYGNSPWADDHPLSIAPGRSRRLASQRRAHGTAGAETQVIGARSQYATRCGC